MSNKIIKNTQESTLDLTPMRDVFDVVLVLRPKGTPGDSREISEETANDEVVARVLGARWVTLSDATSTAVAEITVAPPVAEVVTPVDTAPMFEEPKAEESKAEPEPVAEEPKTEVPTEAATVSETPVEPSSRTFPAEPPHKSKRR